MNSRLISLVVLAVNLGLAGTLIYLILTYQRAGTLNAPLRPKFVTNTVTQIAVRKVNATNSLLASLGNRPLSWQALESTNYSIYIQNLAAFGCPDETIRDIILTDICKLYAKRRAQIRAQLPPPKFWETSETAPSPLTLDIRRRLRELEQEQNALVRDLLGVDFREELDKYWDNSSVDDPARPTLSFLSGEKQQAVQTLQGKYAELEAGIYNRSRGVLLDEDQAALQQLNKQREAEMAQVLTPGELEEYQLHNSDTADSLRSEMAGFQPSEEEFRKIFKLQKTFDDQFGSAFDPTDDKALAVRAAAQGDATEALSEEIKKTLGPQRFAEYERGQDGDYRSLVQVAERFNLPRDVAGSVYDMKVAAERQKAQVEGNANLSAEQRAAMLVAIAKATERGVASALGENIYKSYQRSAGQWLGNLYQVNENNLALPPEPPPLPPLPPELLRYYLSLPPNVPPPR